MKRYFIMFMQTNLVFLGLGGMGKMLFSDYPFIIKLPAAALLFSATMTFAFSVDEYHAREKEKLLK